MWPASVAGGEDGQVCPSGALHDEDPQEGGHQGRHPRHVWQRDESQSATGQDSGGLAICKMNVFGCFFGATCRCRLRTSARLTRIDKNASRCVGSVFHGAQVKAYAVKSVRDQF